MPTIITRADHPTQADRGARVTTTHRPAVLLPWSRFGRIATAAQEARFVADLEHRCGGTPAGHRRGDITAVLNALRGGLTVDQLLDQAPGLCVARLYGAHTHLEARRRDAAAAWREIVADPTDRALSIHGPEASALLPVPIQRLRRITAKAPDRLADAVAQSVRQVEAAGATVRRIEEELDRGFHDVQTAAHLARMLFDQHGECALAHDDHLPERVGGLVPTRVAALLGERHLTPDDSVVP